jgi:DnaJ-class molecular chaperone
MDPYKVLGIERGISEIEIKKAYKDLVRTAHPDKGGTEEKFKEINEAYMQIMKGEDPAQTFPELNEIFKMFTELSGMVRGPTIKTYLELTLEELELGGKFSVKYKRNVQSGNFINSVSSTPFGVINIITPEEMEKTFETTIDVPRCHDIRKSLIYYKAARANSLPAGDLDVSIILKKHPVFTMIPGTLDIQLELDISLKEALVGFNRDIKQLNSEETVKIECMSIVNPYDIKRIQNYGMKLNDDKYGDMLIKFRILFPVILSGKSINTIQNIEDL